MALAKLTVRMGVIVVFSFLWYRYPDPVTKRRVFWFYFPFLCYLLWAFLSASWSPLRTVSVGQALGLTSLVALSTWIALFCREPSYVNYAARQLWSALLVFSLVLLAVHIVRPDLSGLTRDLQIRGANGMIHPTYAAATAGLGFVLTLLGPKLLRGFDLGYGVYAGLAIHGLLLFFANSRTSLALTLAVSAIGILWLYPRRTHAALLVTAACAMFAYVVIDPGFVLHKQNLRESTEYITRGQSQKQLTGLSGRVEMWDAVWKQFERSPLIGHGYFVTSENGQLDVWDGPSNHTAHNLALQVLVSTGIIGGAIFLFAFWRVGSAIWRLRRGDGAAQAVFVLILLVALWYLGWSQTCISFIGPVLPESVVFFLLLGLGVGQVIRFQPPARPYHEAIAT